MSVVQQSKEKLAEMESQESENSEGLELPDNLDLGTEESSENKKVENSKAETSESPPAPVYEGMKKINSNDELLSYVRELEQNNISIQSELKGVKSVNPGSSSISQENSNDSGSEPLDQDYMDRIFTDPASVLREVKESAKSEVLEAIKRDQSQREQAQKFWSDFYSENEDLADVKDYVDYVRNSNIENWKNLSVEEGKKALVSKVRADLSKLRGGGSGRVETLTDSPASSFGPSGEVPRPPVVEVKAKNFVEQLQEFQQSKKKANY